MAVMIPGAGCAARNSSASGATVLGGSLRFDGNNSYLKRPFHNGNTRIFTISCWVKRNKLYDSVGQNFYDTVLLDTAYGGKRAKFVFYSNRIMMESYNGSTYDFSLTSVYEFRDTSAWYHVVGAVDTTHAVQSERVRFYINGKRIDSDMVSGTWPNQYATTMFNSGIVWEDRIGWDEINSYYSKMLLSDYYFIDGQALDESYFGYTDPLTNTWRPKKYTGDYNVSAGGDFVVSGAPTLTWDDNPIGAFDLTNSDKTATTNDLGNGYANGDVWSDAIPANTTYAWTLDIRNGDSTGGWYFTDSQTDSGTHADERGWNSCGMRGAETSMGTYGTFTTANGTSDGQNQITLNAAVSPNGTKKIDFVVYRPSSGVGKVWIRGNGDILWIGGGDPTNTSSTASFLIPDGTTYFGMTAYARNPPQVFTFDELVTSQTGLNSFYLPLDESTVVGKDQSGIVDINDGSDWSAYVAGLAPTAGYGKDKMFNGATNGSYLAGSGTVTVTFPGGGLDFSNSLRIMAQVTTGNKDIIFNWSGGSYTLNVTAIGAVWWDVTNNVTSPITSIQWTSDGNNPYVNALEVDNVIMNKCVEGHSWTPEFLVGSNVIPKAEGAFPILNTVNGGKVATSGVRKEVGPNTLQIVKDSGCVSFDGSQDYLTVDNSATSSDYDFGSGEFTMECWFNSKADSGNHYCLVSKGDSAASTSSWRWTLTDKVFFYFYYGGASQTVEQPAPSPFTPSIWNHCAVVRDSNTLRMYINGTQVDTADLSGGGTPLVMNTTAHDVRIGDDINGNEPLDAFLSNVRIVKGSCLYPNGTTFTPSTKPLTNVTNTKLLCCQSPTSQIEAAVGSLTATGGVYATYNEVMGSCVLALPLLGGRFDVSNKINAGNSVKTITNQGPEAVNSYSNFYGGSFYFDGNSDYLSVTNHADLDGFYDFTIEMWVFLTDLQVSEVLISKGYSGSGTFPPYMIKNSTSNNLEFFASSNGTSFDVADAVPFGPSQGLLEGWHHIAVTRQGSSGKLFLNGILKSEFNSNTKLHAPNSSSITIFSQDNGASAAAGYAQDVRIYNGVAKYTKNFIPASTDPDITSDTPSGVALGSQVTKVTDNYGSMAFGGNMGFLSIGDGSNDDLAPGTGSFTLEFFVYIGEVFSGNDPGIMCWSPNSVPHGNFQSGGVIFFDPDSQTITARLGTSSGYTDATTSTGSVRQYTWHHIALVRDNDFIRIFVDGSNVYTDNTSHTNTDITDKYMIIGKYYDNNDYVLNGNISNFRFIKGTALYADSFTPPTEPLTNVTNTKLLCCQSPFEQKNNFVRMYKSLGWKDGLVVQSDPYDNLSDILNKATEVNDREYVGIAGISSSWVYLVPSITGISTVRFDTNVGVGSTSVWNQNSSNMTNPGPSFSFYWRDGNSWTQTSGTYGLTTEWTLFNYGHDDTVNYTINMDREFYVLGSDTVNGYGGGPNPKLISGEVPYRDRYYSYKCEVSPYSSSWGGNMELMVSSDDDLPPGISTLSTASHFNPFTSDNINTVMGQETEYCTWNPLCISGITTNILTNGNLTVEHAQNTGWSGNPAATGYSQFVGNMGLESGKWYFETFWDPDSGPIGVVGISNHAMGSENYPGSSSAYNSVGYAAGSPHNTVYIHPHDEWGYPENWMPQARPNDIIGVAIDMDDGKLYFSLNGAFINHARPEEGTGYVAENLNSGIGTHDRCVYPVISQVSHADKIIATTNFGQKPFKYQPPEGFQPLSFANLPTPIVRPDQYVGVTTWPGTGTSPYIIGGYQFSPDFVWVKEMNGTRAPILFDTVRGVQEPLYSNSGDEQITAPTSLLSFNKDGFTVGTDNHLNQSDQFHYVGWCWKAGGNKGTWNIDDVEYPNASAAGLGHGNLAVLGCSVGTKQGFSIIKYQGNASPTKQMVPHGLTKRPDFIMVKNMDAAYEWMVQHRCLGAEYYGILDNDTTFKADADVWGDTEPTGAEGFPGHQNSTTSVFYVQHHGSTNQGYTNGYDASNNDYKFIAYLWHDVPGLQKFGRYTANYDSNPDNGPFVYLGFRPAIVLVKNADDVSDWMIYDNIRDPHNPVSETLYPNDNNSASGGQARLDFLSNGFKIRSGNVAPNVTAGNSWIYAAWAEQPMNNLYGAQSNAR